MALLDFLGERGRAKKSVPKQDRRDKAMRGEQIMKKYGHYQVFSKEHQRFQADRLENRNYLTDKTTEYLHVLRK